MGKRKLSIILPKAKATHQEVLNYGRNVYTGMSGNETTFPSPVPTMADFKTKLDDFEKAIPSELNLSPAINNMLNVQQDSIMLALTDLSQYALFMAKNDRAIAGLSGFELNKENSESRTVKNLVLRYAKPGASQGTAIVRFEDRAGCNFFVAERLNGNGTWAIYDAFDSVLYQLENLSSGDNELRFYGKKGREKTPNVLSVSVRVL